MSAELEFSSLDEKSEMHSDFYIRSENKRKITFNESANQVKYFNIDAPPVEVNQTIVAKDGSIILRLSDAAIIPVKIRYALKNILRTKVRGKTLQEWLKKMCFSAPYSLVFGLLGYIFYTIYRRFVYFAEGAKPT
ncbi:hypothetical protein HUJ04_012790 [Dendroctonus ponderosae]|nr:hypothetical protein HUJ04_012790 [Dendroctonus ponderosae]KAH1030061.1 hypothetical protein HUJ05_003194 [Dendroctonus ponderosae]